MWKVKAMRKWATKHFNGIKQAIPNAKRLMLFDFDNEDFAFKPKPGNQVLYEWKRKNIENYLFMQFSNRALL